MVIKATILKYIDTNNDDSGYDTNEMDTDQYEIDHYMESCIEVDTGKDQNLSNFCDDDFQHEDLFHMDLENLKESETKLARKVEHPREYISITQPLCS